jgi:signal transduction histidine kinase
MGLPIVKHLVELQNGTIEMSSEVEKGTEIKLKFPYLM